jgi:hypothetical protein
VQTTGDRIDRRGQRVDIGRLQLRERAVVEDLRGQRMLLRQAREDVDVGRETGLAAAYAALGQSEALEQHGAQLRRRADVELAAGELVDLAHQPVHARGELAAQRAQALDVDQHAAPLDARQHADQRHLHFVEQRPQRGGIEAAAQLAGQRMQHTDAGRHPQ